MAEEEAFVPQHEENVGEEGYHVVLGITREKGAVEDGTRRNNKALHLLCVQATRQKTKSQAALTLQGKRKGNRLQAILYFV